MASWLRALLLASLLSTGCSQPWPVDTPPPPVAAAPVALRSIAIHVHQLASPPESAQDAWDYHHMPGYTAELRRALVEQLQRAGYTVVVDRNQPYDAVAVVQATWPSHRAGTATAVISAQGETVAILSAAIPFVGEPPRIEHLEGDAAVALVHAVSRSPEIHALSRELETRRPGAVIAQ
jgi:hypothetical protein